MNKYINPFKNKPIFFIPGGPWINGAYVSINLLPMEGYDIFRFAHFNHENGYKKKKKYLHQENINHLIKFIDANKQDEVIIIGHSYGGLLAAYIIKEKLLPSLHITTILVSTPLNSLKSEEYVKKLSLIKSKDVTKDAEFLNRWRELILLYSNSIQAQKYLSDQEVYWEGNKNACFNQSEIKSIQEYIVENISKFNFIYGERDPLLTENSLVRASNSRTLMAAHFPMLEEPGIFTDAINSFFKNPIIKYNPTYLKGD